MVLDQVSIKTKLVQIKNIRNLNTLKIIYQIKLKIFKGNKIKNKTKTHQDQGIIIMNIIIKVIMLNIYIMISKKDLIINKIQILFYQIKYRNKIV